MRQFLISVRVGFFLALSDLKRNNLWTTALIIFVMTLSFINILAVRGVLLGVAEGVQDSYKKLYSGDVFITSANTKTKLDQTTKIYQILKNTPGIITFSGRYIAPVTVQSGYRDQVNPNDALDASAGVLAGINPRDELSTTLLSRYIKEGRFLSDGDYDQVVLGKNFLLKYALLETIGQKKLKYVGIGSTVRIKVGDVTREVKIKGIIYANNTGVDNRAYMIDSEVRSILHRDDFAVNEIAIKIAPTVNPFALRDYLRKQINDPNVLVQEAQEALPGSITDIKSTFAIMGNVIGGIGLMVAAITIFIVIFVNAITRRKYIGIMKGIGITSSAIEISYVFQSFFYAVVGTLIGSFIILGLIKPYVYAHPIVLPIANAYINATVDDVIIRGILLVVATLIAGFIPAWMIIRQNTLDAILGR